MQTRLDDLALSRLMLGTVQFGMPYGIANRAGQPSYETACDILRCAYGGGVRCLDTAAEYGASQEVIGRALRELGIADTVTVATKVRHVGATAPQDVERTIEESVGNSLRALGLEVLPICLFHGEQDFAHVAALLRLKERGLIRHIGSSVMTTDAATAILRSGLADAVQLPVNLLDQSFVRRGVIAEAQQRGVAIFARSVYLQGLLVMPEQEIPPHLADVLPVRLRLDALASNAGMSLAEMALRYALSLDGVTCALVGVETVEQMRANLAMWAKGPLEPALMRAIDETVPDLPYELVTPHYWPQLKSRCSR
jgi:aryl-alcohol dehydrogenase-like predicted oxidoreductase